MQEAGWCAHSAFSVTLMSHSPLRVAVAHRLARCPRPGSVRFPTHLLALCSPPSVPAALLALWINLLTGGSKAAAAAARWQRSGQRVAAERDLDHALLSPATWQRHYGGGYGFGDGGSFGGGGFGDGSGFGDGGTPLLPVGAAAAAWEAGGFGFDGVAEAKAAEQLRAHQGMRASGLLLYYTQTSRTQITPANSPSDRSALSLVALYKGLEARCPS